MPFLFQVGYHAIRNKTQKNATNTPIFGKKLQKNAVTPQDNILIVDDVLATGGTAVATTILVRKLGGTCVNAAFLIRLSDLQGKERMEQLGVQSFSIINF